MRSLSIQEINKRLHNRFTLLDRRRPRAARAPADAARAGRVVVRPLDRQREAPVRPARRLRRRLRPAGRRGGLRRGSAHARRRARPRDVARRQVARHGPRDGRRVALPDAGDAARVRRSKALGKRGEQRRDRDAPLRPLPRDREGGEQRAAGPGATRNGRAGSKPSSTTCAPRSRSRFGGGTDPDHRREVRGRAAGIPASCADTRPRAASTFTPRSRCPACSRRTSRMRTRSTSAPCSRTTRATTPRPGRMLEPCLELRRKIGNPVDVAATLSMLADGAAARRRRRAGARMRRGSARHLPRRSAIGSARRSGSVTWARSPCTSSDDAKAREYFEQCLAIARVHRPPRARRRVRALPRRALAARRATFPAARAALRPLARSREGQPRTSAAKRSPSGGPARPTSRAATRESARAQAGRRVARVPGGRDERRAAGLRRGPCRTAASARHRPGSRAHLRGARGGAGTARAAAPAAQREGAGKTASRRPARRWVTRHSTPRGPRDTRGSSRWRSARTGAIVGAARDRLSSASRSACALIRERRLGEHLSGTPKQNARLEFPGGRIFEP